MSKEAPVGSPVNFDNLHTLTSGNADVEAELFRIFLDSSQDCLMTLRNACSTGDEMAWKQSAHAFKGLCLNLGAEPLGLLCNKAQHDCRASSAEKEALLTALEQELTQVKLALESALAEFLKNIEIFQCILAIY
jgi:histidine phosphotransfer protein HptB